MLTSFRNSTSITSVGRNEAARYLGGILHVLPLAVHKRGSGTLLLTCPLNVRWTRNAQPADLLTKGTIARSLFAEQAPNKREADPVSCSTAHLANQASSAGIAC
jgi:hypothetical protein